MYVPPRDRNALLAPAGPTAPATLTEELAAIIGNPGTVVDRLPGEKLTDWCARAILLVLATDPELPARLRSATDNGETGR